MDHVREQIEKFKNLGFSPESAKEMVQSERGKVPVTKTIEEKVYKGLEGTGVMGAVLDKFLSSKKVVDNELQKNIHMDYYYRYLDYSYCLWN